LITRGYSAAIASRQARELARRVSGGMEITLFWTAAGNRTSVEIAQPASGESLLFEVPRSRALEAFYHPFTHLPVGW
jgi:hypothetical protein